MTTAPVSPFVLVGDPTAAACEGELCPVPAVREQVPAPVVGERVPVVGEVVDEQPAHP